MEPNIMCKEKICTKCKSKKCLSEFYQQSDRKNGQSYCKSCFNDYCQERWINKKINAIEYKGGCCQDCKLSLKDTHYSVFEFHHLDPSKKDADWTKLRLTSGDKIKAELEKCVLLCANCHRIRHAK